MVKKGKNEIRKEDFKEDVKSNKGLINPLRNASCNHLSDSVSNAFLSIISCLMVIKNKPAIFQPIRF